MGNGFVPVARVPTAFLVLSIFHVFLLLKQLHYELEISITHRIEIEKSNCFSINQEPITRSLQLPHIPVTRFSQTDLFLV